MERSREGSAANELLCLGNNDLGDSMDNFVCGEKMTDLAKAREFSKEVQNILDERPTPNGVTLFKSDVQNLARAFLEQQERVEKLEKVVEEAKFMRMLLKKHDSFDKALTHLDSEAKT